ncbi:hypothetical protein [Pontixanthobacter luteolus]|uniref:hypothetical protein n=1 Tax=Pontixanthobacter luteolus TaxID=295089 RepID=UPI0023022A46|nr:hypothetical protein [Pontixanthobacter luteolus]
MAGSYLACGAFDRSIQLCDFVSFEFAASDAADCIKNRFVVHSCVASMMNEAAPIDSWVGSRKMVFRPVRGKADISSIRWSRLAVLKEKGARISPDALNFLGTALRQ